VLRFARENPRWGYERIVGELARVGVRVSATTVAKILRQAGVSPAGVRVQPSSREFLRAHADSIIACDSFTVETLWLGRLYVLFFLELGSRRVHFAGCTTNPDGRWTAGKARQLVWSLSERATPARFLIHDRDSKFSRAFDEVFRTEGVEIIRTPFHAPKANAFAERWVGSVRRDCLDWLLISSRRQLERVLRVYVDHYNTHRPHRALGLTAPIQGPRLRLVGPGPPPCDIAGGCAGSGQVSRLEEGRPQRWVTNHPHEDDPCRGGGGTPASAGVPVVEFLPDGWPGCSDDALVQATESALSGSRALNRRLSLRVLTESGGCGNIELAAVTCSSGPGTDREASISSRASNRTLPLQGVVAACDAPTLRALAFEVTSRLLDQVEAQVRRSCPYARRKACLYQTMPNKI